MSSKHVSRNVHGTAAKEFAKRLEKLTCSKSRWEIFSDWTLLAASSIYNQIHADPQVEEEYLAIAKRYKPEELTIMSEMLGLVARGLEEEHSDFLGQVYEGALLSSDAHGQFFTPFSVSRMLAEVTFAGEIPVGRIITIGEPACGAGGMAIAACAVLAERGFDFQNWAYIEARDIDALCVRMTYIQLSLIGASALVIQGDTLANSIDRVWATPMYEMTLMGPRIRNQEERENGATEPETSPVEGLGAHATASTQFELFAS